MIMKFTVAFKKEHTQWLSFYQISSKFMAWVGPIISSAQCQLCEDPFAWWPSAQTFHTTQQEGTAIWNPRYVVWNSIRIRAWDKYNSATALHLSWSWQWAVQSNLAFLSRQVMFEIADSCHFCRFDMHKNLPHIRRMVPKTKYSTAKKVVHDMFHVSIPSQHSLRAGAEPIGWVKFLIQCDPNECTHCNNNLGV